MKLKVKTIKSVTTKVDLDTERQLLLIHKKLEIKPAAVARRGIKSIIPELLKQIAQS